MNGDDPRLPWLAFQVVFLDNRYSAWKAFSRLSSVETILSMGRSALVDLGFHPKAAERIASGDAEREAREALAATGTGTTILTYADADYPALLREIPDPPPVLFAAGDVGALAGPCVAVVGARAPTPYGRAVAGRLAADLAARGAVVVSGMARGIDACAHRGALETPGGRTVAVFGCGLDIRYPPENADLAERIRERGALLTELPPGTPPFPQHFPLRNRIISGLSLGLVAVEAAERSGSLISAKLALEQGREVMAVPGNATSPLSRGTNGLIRAGAKLVEGWEDVAEELPPPWRDDLLRQRDEAAPGPPAALNAREDAVIQCLATDAAVHVDELAERTELSVSELLAVLLGLELKGAVLQHPGKYYQRSL